MGNFYFWGGGDFPRERESSPEVLREKIFHEKKEFHLGGGGRFREKFFTKGEFRHDL